MGSHYHFKDHYWDIFVRWTDILSFRSILSPLTFCRVHADTASNKLSSKVQLFLTQNWTKPLPVPAKYPMGLEFHQKSHSKGHHSRNRKIREWKDLELDLSLVFSVRNMLGLNIYFYLWDQIWHQPLVVLWLDETDCSGNLINRMAKRIGFCCT